MSEASLTSINVGKGQSARRIAVRMRQGAVPGLVWLGGFKSDMQGTKAVALDAWAAEAGRACLRFDYSGHGESGGAFTDGTIGRWLEESAEVFEAFARGPQVLVGSSMGGWIALCAVLLLGALHLCRGEEARPVRNLWAPMALSIVVAGLLVYGTLGLPEFADPQAPIHTHVVPRYLNELKKEVDIPNVVTAVLASYRGYDTLGETTVVFTAGAGVIALLRRRRKDREP